MIEKFKIAQKNNQKMDNYLDSYSCAVVIPCYKVESHIADVVESLPLSLKHIILVNDCSPDGSAAMLHGLKSKDGRIVVMDHQVNQGVGGAMLSGFEKALELGCDYIIKMDGDGQMDPKYIPDLLSPLIREGYHFSKGNRFWELENLPRMPLVRRLGNLGLSFMIKASSGYWDLFDPTNGYFCISKDVLKRLKMDRLSKRYFFESSLLIELYYTGAKICDVPMGAKYGDEESNLSVSHTLFTFPPKLVKALVRRVFCRFFIFEFSIFSIYLLIGVPLLGFGMIFGVAKWIEYSSMGVPAPTGTVMVATLAIVLGFQLLLSVIQHDVSSKNPFRKPMKKYRDEDFE